METIAQKLAYTEAAVDGIMDALVSKQAVTPTTPLSAYEDAINGLALYDPDALQGMETIMRTQFGTIVQRQGEIPTLAEIQAALMSINLRSIELTTDVDLPISIIAEVERAQEIDVNIMVDSLPITTVEVVLQ